MQKIKHGPATIRISGTPERDKLKAATRIFMKKVNVCRRKEVSRTSF